MFSDCCPSPFQHDLRDLISSRKTSIASRVKKKNKTKSAQTRICPEANLIARSRVTTTSKTRLSSNNNVLPKKARKRSAARVVRCQLLRSAEEYGIAYSDPTLVQHQLFKTSQIPRTAKTIPPPQFSSPIVSELYRLRNNLSEPTTSVGGESSLSR